MKTDFKKEIAAYRAPRGAFEVIDVPPLRFLMVDGAGDPNTSPWYQEAVSALFGVAYKVKFLSRKELDRDYTVMPLEGLWWADDPSAFTSRRDKSQWSWTMMIMVPDWTTAEHVESARDAVTAKLAGVPVPDRRAIDELRLERLDEGRCVQTLHIGSFDDEGPVLARMHDEFIPGAGLRMTGRHHEIYLSDPRRTEPAKLRTILRQPVADAG